MLKIARGRGIPDSYRHLLEELERRHFVVQDDGKSRLFASTFRDFVTTEGVEEGGGFLRRLFKGVRT